LLFWFLNFLQRFQILTPVPEPLPFSSYAELRSQLEAKKISCLDVVRLYLANIESQQSLNAFTAVFTEKALARAKALDAKLAAGQPLGKLFGLPVAVKDVIAIKDEKLTCSSKILSNFTSLYNATAIDRLEAEDVIILGKTNMDEFAMGSSTENSCFGPTRNPLDPTRVPGGSSGGSAVAVAAKMSLVALGSDTGGSVCQPSSFCGVVGVKPTYGRVSRYGLVAYGSSFDQIGVFANNIDDAALVMGVIAGHDAMDSTCSAKPVPAYLSKTVDVSKLRVGIPKEFFSASLAADIKAAVMAKVDFLKSKGATVKEVSLPHSDYSLATYYILATAEASSNLSRFDGARYGYRSPNATDLTSMYVKSRSEGFGIEVKRRIMLGTYVLSSGYYDAYYRKAQQVRRLIREDFLNAFKDVDVILGPTSPVPPFKIGEKMDDPLTMYLADIYTVPINLSGLPTASLPAGRDANGLPIGFQVIGQHFGEETIFEVAKVFAEK
jgi:aspartyl-tRNA(Asn)/glutamyl-tRNA(Gln) amidotransferase subunit A